MRVVRVVFILLFAPLIGLGQKLTDAEREIMTFQDQRSLGNGRLLMYLSATDPQLRCRSLLALANIQDSLTAPAVVSRLHDPEPRVRSAAAFALGMIGVKSMQDSLLAAMEGEQDSTVLARIFEALGRIGDDRSLERVVGYQGPVTSSFLAGEQVLSAARFALRGIKNERSIWFCFDQSANPDGEVRWKALYALWRSVPHGLIDIEIAKRSADLANLLRDRNIDVRVNLIALLSKSKSEYAFDLIEAAKDSDSRNPNWLVEVQLARAFAAMAETHPDCLNNLVGYLAMPNDHVQIAAMQSLYGLQRQMVITSADTVKLRRELMRLLSAGNNSAVPVRGEAYIALARLYPVEFSHTNFLAGQNLPAYEQAKIIEALSYLPSGRSLSIILYSLDNPNVRVAMAAWDFIRRFLTPGNLAKIRSGDPDWIDARSSLYRKTLYALSRKDMAITQLVSSALGDTSYFGMFKEAGLSDSLVFALRDAFGRLASPDDVETMQAAANAMGSMKDPRFVSVLENALGDPDKTVATAAADALRDITGKDYSSRIPSATRAVHTDYDWSTLESLSAAVRVRIETSRGLITLQLMKDDAPFTVLSFVKLVRKDFYNGLRFHRVVPDFVIQGGDPRGDGWGGPGYAIRSEISFARFGRGAVGIASSGKDTEGCQFFITHIPTPHLDGRYTIFARVVEGQDVVDRIQIGDTITRISLQ